MLNNEWGTLLHYPDSYPNCHHCWIVTLHLHGPRLVHLGPQNTHHSILLQIGTTIRSYFLAYIVIIHGDWVVWQILVEGLLIGYRLLIANLFSSIVSCPATGPEHVVIELVYLWGAWAPLPWNRSLRKEWLWLGHRCITSVMHNQIWEHPHSDWQKWHHSQHCKASTTVQWGRPQAKEECLVTPTPVGLLNVQHGTLSHFGSDGINWCIW